MDGSVQGRQRTAKIRCFSAARVHCGHPAAGGDHAFARSLPESVGPAGRKPNPVRIRIWPGMSCRRMASHCCRLHLSCVGHEAVDSWSGIAACAAALSGRRRNADLTSGFVCGSAFTPAPLVSSKTKPRSSGWMSQVN